MGKIVSFQWLLYWLPFVLYLLSLIWLLLFPAVSVTTQEAKPRGLYVDENALLVHNKFLERHGYADSNSFRKNYKQKLQELQLYNTDSNESHCDGDINREKCLATNSVEPNICELLQFYSKSSSFLCNKHNCKETIDSAGFCSSSPYYELVVDSIYRPLSSDSIAIVLAYSADNRKLRDELVLIVSNLVDVLTNSRWLAKRVVFVVVPVNATTTAPTTNWVHSEQLEHWLNYYYPINTYFNVNQRNSNYNKDGSDDSPSELEFRDSIGLLREAYVIDMRGLTAERDSPITTASSLLYDRIQLLSTGLNGQQPNMDMISALLAIAPQTITIGEQYQQSYSRVHNYPSDCYPYEISSPCFCNGLTSFIHQSIQLLHNSLITYFDKTTAGIMHNYFHRLSGLLSHMLAHLLGPNGYHYHFLMRNIDSVTLRVVPTATKTSTDRNSKKKSTISENNNNVSDAESMRFFLLQLVYLSNNLYEELHHSYFFYYLMGDGYFVGVTEYGFAGGLLLLSLLLMTLKLSNTDSAGAKAQKQIVNDDGNYEHEQDVSTSPCEDSKTDSGPNTTPQETTKQYFRSTIACVLFVLILLLGSYALAHNFVLGYVLLISGGPNLWLCYTVVLDHTSRRTSVSSSSLSRMSSTVLAILTNPIVYYFALLQLNNVSVRAVQSIFYSYYQAYNVMGANNLLFAIAFSCLYCGIALVASL